MLKQPVLDALQDKGIVHCMELMQWSGKPRSAVQMVPELRYMPTPPILKLNVAETNHSCLRTEKPKP